MQTGPWPCSPGPEGTWHAAAESKKPTPTPGLMSEDPAVERPPPAGKGQAEHQARLGRRRSFRHSDWRLRGHSENPNNRTTTTSLREKELIKNRQTKAKIPGADPPTSKGTGPGGHEPACWRLPAPTWRRGRAGESRTQLWLHHGTCLGGGACPSPRTQERQRSQRGARVAAGHGHLPGRVGSSMDGLISTGFTSFMTVRGIGTPTI